MLDKEFIDKLRDFKRDNDYTLYELSRRIDVQVTTLERWLKTNRINKLYAKTVRDKLGI